MEQADTKTATKPGTPKNPNNPFGQVHQSSFFDQLTPTFGMLRTSSIFPSRSLHCGKTSAQIKLPFARTLPAPRTQDAFRPLVVEGIRLAPLSLWMTPLVLWTSFADGLHSDSKRAGAVRPLRAPHGFPRTPWLPHLRYQARDMGRHILIAQLLIQILSPTGRGARWVLPFLRGHFHDNLGLLGGNHRFMASAGG